MSRKNKVGGFHTPFAGLGKLRDELAPPPAKPGAPAKPAAKAAPAPAPSRAKSDEELFLEEMGGTARIEKATGRVAPPPPEKKARVRSDEAEVLAELAELVFGGGTFDIADSDEYIEGAAHGVDKKIQRRLRAGDYAVQAHVDLHGLTRDEAKARVVKFVEESRKAGRRCVLIVHGRGLHSKDQVPVLKEAVRTWLERGPVARAVLAFATARPHDGGAGAVYVLLRRT